MNNRNEKPSAQQGHVMDSLVPILSTIAALVDKVGLTPSGLFQNYIFRKFRKIYYRRLHLRLL
jgi:hypothetical protein